MTRLEEQDQFMSLDALIRKLERRREKVGGDSTVALAGFDPGTIVCEDNYDLELYPAVKTLLEVGE